jgi:hypothetical protein
VSHILQVVWPITDDTYTRNELIDIAKGDLEEMADQAHAVITGPPIWYIADAADTPGWTGYAPGMVLVANLPAEPYGALSEHKVGQFHVDPATVERLIAGNPPAKVRATERTTAMVSMANRGAEIPAVASRFRVTTDAVNQAIQRHRHRDAVAA